MQKSNQSTQIYYFGQGRYILENANIANDMLSFVNEKPYTYTLSINMSEDALPICNQGISYNGQSSVMKNDNNWLFWLNYDGDSPDTVLQVSSDYTSGVFYSSGAEISKYKSHDRALNHLRTIYDAILPMNGGTIIHSSCIKYNDYALLFLAPSQTGKSTQMHLWKKHQNAKLISSDAPAVFPCNAYGDDVLTAYGMPWDGSDRIMTQDDAPIIAFVELRQAKYNSLRKLTASQAFYLLMHQGHTPLWDQEAMFHSMLVLKRIASNGAFYRLNCLPDQSATELVKQALFNNQTELIERESTEMRIKEGYELRNVVDEYIVMPTGDNMKDFGGALVLSETSAYVWNLLKKNITRQEIINDVIHEYDIEVSIVEKDVDKLIAKLKEYDVIEDM